MRRISILNFKGGVGKTSLAINLSYALSQKGYAVLLVDCDRQRNASSILPDDVTPKVTLSHVLKQQTSFLDAVVKARENLYVLPAGKDLETASNHIVAMGMRAYKTLATETRDMGGFDFLFFDHSPSYGPITETALLASDEMLIPVLLEPFAMEGLVDMIDKLAETLGGLDHEVHLSGIVPFALDERYSMTGQYLDSLRRHFGEQVIHAVRTDADVAKSQSLHQSIFEYNPKNRRALEDFAAIADALAPEGVLV